MASVSSLGVGSGIDLQSLVDGLVSAESALRLGRLDQREGAATERLSAYGVLRSSLSEFQTALQSLSQISTFQERSVTSSNEDAFQVSASLAAPLGRFSIEVLQAGQSQRLTATGLTDITGALISTGDQTLGGGTLTIQQPGNGAFIVEISSGQSSLDEVAAAINAADDNQGVSASVITADTGTVLVLESTDTGSDNAITVTVDDIDGDDTDASGLSQLAFDPALPLAPRFVETQLAADAQISISGQTITSSNGSTFSDAVTGLTITALEVTSEPESFTVTENFSQASSAANDFVDAFNALNETITSLSTASETGEGRGPLVGDAVLRTLNGQLRQSIFSRFIESQPNGLQSLSDIGISISREGTLELDGSTFSALLESNFSDVVSLLTSPGENVAQVQEFQSIAYAALSAQPGDISITISSGDDSFVVDLNGLDLVAARDAINNATDNIGVTASVALTDNGTGGTDARLQIAGQVAGSNFSITTSNNGGGDVDLFQQSQAPEVFQPLGALSNLDDIIDRYLRGSGEGALAVGIIDGRTNGLNAEIERIGDERLLQQQRLEAFEARLVDQFAALDLLVSNLQSNGNFLLSQLSSLPVPGSNNS